jgi:hypothetical protein
MKTHYPLTFCRGSVFLPEKNLLAQEWIFKTVIGQKVLFY